MKNGTRLALLSLCALSLLSCAEKGPSTSSGPIDSSSMSEAPSEEESVSIPAEDNRDERWGEALVALMKKYCGYTLPYPSPELGENISFEEVDDEDGSKMLKIYDDGGKFTLGEYYEALKEEGWKVITGYNEKAERKVDGYSFYELTRGSGKVGYDLSYTYQPGKGERKGGNVIYCRNHGTTKLTSATDWTEEEKEKIRLATTISLPFMAFGDGYEVIRDDEDTVTIRDHSTTDLSEEYGDALEGAGFTINTMLSQLYDFCVCILDTEEKIISAGLSYNDGNIFKIDFAARPSKSEDWPKAALNDIESVCGIDIPVFTAKDITQYYYYEKNKKVYIYAETSVDIEKSTDYFTKLQKAGFANDGSYHFRNASKKVNVDTKVLTNESLGQVEQYGFQIIAYLDE